MYLLLLHAPTYSIITLISLTRVVSTVNFYTSLLLQKCMSKLILSLGAIVASALAASIFVFVFQYANAAATVTITPKMHKCITDIVTHTTFSNMKKQAIAGRIGGKEAVNTANAIMNTTQTVAQIEDCVRGG